RRVADEDVQTSPAIDDRGDHGVDRFGVSDIGLVRKGLSAGSFDRAGAFEGADGIPAIVRSHAVAVSAKSGRDDAAQASGRAGDVSRAAENQPLLREVQNTEEYFPDGIGSVWQYVGHTHTEQIERIAEVTFKNDVTTIGTSNMHGVMVKIFRETNQGNKGPSDGFFRRDASGIVYYGSQPTTSFEQQLVPYRILNFPLVLGTTFQQLKKTNVDMQADLDGDGRPERGDEIG